MKVAVVTPTIGAESLSQCVESVHNQTYQDLTHYIFLDGEEHEKNIWYQLDNYDNIKTVRLKENVGKGWYGHRVYAACSFLVNADIICYLDEDNWYEPCHVEKIVKRIEEGNDWAYSLRKIYDKEGNFLFEDNCESLGKWPVYFDPYVFHIDTSSFGVKRDIAVKIGQAWYGKWGADRNFFAALKTYFPKFACTNVHTSCYRLDGNENSVGEEFFIKGNKEYQTKYNGDFPWKNSNLHQIESVGPGITIIE